jgi:hypothetical protein
MKIDKQAEQPQEVVERVAKAIRANDHDSDSCKAADEMDCYTIMAKAAIAAMGASKSDKPVPLVRVTTADAPAKETWTCPDCCVNPCICRIMGERPATGGSTPHSPTSPASDDPGPLPDYTSGYSVKGERHTESKDGEAERNECDCLRRPDSEGMPAGLNPASPAKPSEISVVDEESLIRLLIDSLFQNSAMPNLAKAGHLMNVIRPYLGLSAPVSLARCIEAVEAKGIVDNGLRFINRYDAVKAVLDAAEVKYVE